MYDVLVSTLPMTNHYNIQTSGIPTSPQDSERKRPYVRPGFRWESLAFETMALSCGKISSSQGTCHSNTKNS